MRPKNAILLLRISEDKAGDAHGVARDEKDGRAYADRIGWGIGRVIIENDTSAFKRKRIRLPNGRMEQRTLRPGFRETLDLLADGVNDGLLAIDLDRVARDPRDLEDLIDVVESKEPRLPVESVTGSLRLATDADVTMARVMVAIANKSSRDTSRRISAEQARLAAEGKPPGGGFRAYGYARDGVTVIKEEAKVIRWMAERILDDEEFWSLHRIAAALTNEGVPTATGLEEWSGRSVSSILKGPRIAGYRVYKKKIVGDAVWPKILERDGWEAVCAELARRGTGGRSLELKRWLNGVLICGRPECGARLVGCYGNKGPRYWCMPRKGGCGKIAIAAEPAEAEVERQILEYLTDPEVIGRLQDARQEVDSLKVRKDIAEDEADLKQMAAAWARKQVSFAEYMEARKIIEERIEQARALLTSQAPKAARRLAEADDPVAEWKLFSPAARRDVVLALVAGYQVLPFRKGAPRRFDPDRLVPVPHDV